MFLSVPKTGSTAWEDALAPWASLVVRHPPELKHAPLFRYNRFFRPALERFCDGPIDILAVMREPVDWLGSWYRYRGRDDQRDARISTHGLGFAEFVEGYLADPRPAFARIGSQSKFLEPLKDGLSVTHLFRYDDTAGLSAFLEARLGGPVTTRRLNVSPAPNDAGMLRLPEALLSRLRAVCHADFALYDGIATQGAYRALPRGAARAHD
ncbi:MAG: gamma-glutamyl kinase [Pseudomonadota bacterium]